MGRGFLLSFFFFFMWQRTLHFRFCLLPMKDTFPMPLCIDLSLEEKGLEEHVKKKALEPEKTEARNRGAAVKKDASEVRRHSLAWRSTRLLRPRKLILRALGGGRRAGLT
jgi:hypothetical protein